MFRVSPPRALALLALLPATSVAQHTFSDQGQTYDSRIPTPRQVLGYDIGQRFTPHRMIVRYAERVAAASRRVHVDTVGHTAEGRELLVIAIGSEPNMQRIAQIQADAKRLADPRGASAADLSSALGRLPVIVWIAQSVHGGEASGAEAGIALLYQLAAGTDADTRLALDSAIVLIDPAENPDGRERHTHDIERMRSAVALSSDPGALSNTGSWPGPRTSHYYFDLNRDWFILSHPETKGRVRTFMQWWPHVAIDAHEMGSSSTFYFAPPMDPDNKNNPKHLAGWFEKFGLAYKSAFDRHGWSFFRREGYDSFYPGYGESWPMLTGAVGMLFESSSSSGGAVRRSDGTLRTLAQAAWEHYTAEWTTVTFSARNRSSIIRDWAQSREDAIATHARGPTRAVVFERDRQGRGDSLAAKLRENGIEVQQLGAATQLADATLYGENAARPTRLDAGTYVVDLAQPQGHLAKAILEPDAELDSTFIRAEIEARRTAQPDKFYDVTAWSLPFAYRVKTWWTRTLPGPLSPAPATTTSGNGSNGAQPANAQYGYAFEPGSESSIRLLASLLADSVRVWYAQRRFVSNGTSFPRGAFIVRVAANAPNVHDLVRRHASAAGARVASVPSAGVDQGFDLGSNSVLPVRRPDIALLGGPPVQGGSFGFAWFALDQRIRYPVTLVDAGFVTGPGLDYYSVLVVPSVTAGALDQALGDAGRQRLASWVRNGGVLVTIDAASSWVAQERVGLVRVRARRDSTRADSSGGRPLPASVPGAFARVSADTLSPLLAGVLDPEFSVLVNGERIFSVPKDLGAGEAVVRYAPENRLRLSGFFWPEVPARLAHSPYVWTERVGRGRVIAFAGDPNFRDHLRGLLPLFANAVLIGGSF
jgi:hypothetical protein